MAVVKFTARTLEKVCAAPGPGERPRLYWSNDFPAFGIVAGLKAHSYIVQREVNGRPRRVVIGRVGLMSLDEARNEARRVLVLMMDGVDPAADRRRRRCLGVTLAQGRDEHIARLRAKGKSEVTVKDLQECLDRYLQSWLTRPLKDISKLDCRERHRRVTKENGPAAANRAFRYLRAIFNSARKVHELPAENPTIGCEWNSLFRRQNPIPWGDLPAWRAKVEASGPVKRDFLLTVLLTGLRSTDAASMRWADIDLEKGLLTRPKPKGGERKAFVVPISAEVVAILQRRKEENLIVFGAETEFVFPSRTKHGVIKPLTHRRLDGGEERNGVHVLRSTYITAAREAGLDMVEIKHLVNHARPGATGGDVTLGYLGLRAEALRPAVLRVTAFLVEKMGAVTSGYVRLPLDGSKIRGSLSGIGCPM